MNPLISLFRAGMITLILTVSARAQVAGITTTCACFGFYDAKEKLAHDSLTATEPRVGGTRISSGFGLRMHPILGYVTFHFGVDIPAPSGTPIHAAASGVIEEASRKGGYGNYIKIRHSRACATAYAHASRFAPGIYPGGHVTRGQVIAWVGSTGLTTGPHLHYEIFAKGSRVDPCGCISPPTRHRRHRLATKQV